MMTPQEIQNRKFEKAVFGGYDMSGIDEFLDALIPDYTALYKETMTLKNKMKVLVDKIEEYRSVDEEMRKALYSAQVAAKETVQKAQAQATQLVATAEMEAARIIDGAHAEADGRVAEMKHEIEAEELRLREAKSAAAHYASTMIEILHKNIAVIESIAEKPAEAYVPKPAAVPENPPQYDFEVSMPRMPEPLSDDDLRSDDIEIAYEDSFEEENTQDEQEPQEDDSEGADKERVSRFKFENLKFGKEYDQNDDK